jgi:hypothetical protein
MKLLRVSRIKVQTSKGRINKDETVILDDAEYNKIVYMTPDAFEVLEDNYVEPKPVIAEPVEVAPKPRRARTVKVVK